MAKAQSNNLSGNNEFYRKHYHTTLLTFVVLIFLMLFLVSILLYQVTHRPHPPFNAVTPQGQPLALIASYDPNLQSGTLTKWASKAVVAAYTLNFANPEEDIALARPYFTDTGWASYQASVASLIQAVKQNQLFVYGIVAGAPVISNQGDLPKHGYTWRIQIPFLVIYITTDGSETRRAFYVNLTIVKIPTSENPVGIGIEQFEMKSR